jgi:DnaJ family protein C protein 11
VIRQASLNEINNAYHRLSRMYHPDKHGDSERKNEAVELFNRAKKAHEVLSDEQKRAIYDTLGEKALDTNKWKLVTRGKSAEEIREEFEQMKRRRQEREMKQRTNPRGSLEVQIDASDLFLSKRRRKKRSVDLFELLSLPRLAVNSMSITQAVDIPMGASWNSSLSGALKSDTQHRSGSGQVIGNVRRQFGDRTFAELQVSGGQGPMFVLRGSKAITNKSVVTSTLTVHFLDNVVAGNAEFSYGKQFSKHMVGYLTWKAGYDSSMSSALVYDREKNRFQAQVQIGRKDCFLALSYLRRFDLNSTRLKTALKFSVLGTSLEYGCQTKLTKHSHIGAGMSIMQSGHVSLKLK